MRGFCPRGARLRTPALYFNRCAAPAKLPIQPCPTICRPGQWAPDRQHKQAGVPHRHCRPQAPPSSTHLGLQSRLHTHKSTVPRQNPETTIPQEGNCSPPQVKCTHIPQTGRVSTPLENASIDPLPPAWLVGKFPLLHSRSATTMPEALTRARDRKAYRISGISPRVWRGAAEPPRGAMGDLIPSDAADQHLRSAHQPRS